MKRLILFMILASLCLFSCQDYGSDPYEAAQEVEDYKGTTLDYLSEGNNPLNLKFDSMLVVIENIPELKQLLANRDVNYTVFAVPNECFQSAFKSLNHFRTTQKLGGEIRLENLLIEPFTVSDTSIVSITPLLKDTTITLYHYDYKARLEEMLCKYIFEGEYDTEKIINNEGNFTLYAFKYNYLMNIECIRRAASGLTGIGAKAIFFSDMKNTQSKDNWFRSNTVRNDIYTRNGLVHILSPGHNFSFDEFIHYFLNYGNEYKKK